MGEQGPGGGRGPVGAAVVDDQQLGPLEVDGAVGDGGVEALHALGQAVGLVEGGDDDGEFECHGSGARPYARARRVSPRGRRDRLETCHGPEQADRAVGGARTRRMTGHGCGQGWAAPTNPSDQTGSKVTTVPVWAAWMMVSLP